MIQWGYNSSFQQFCIQVVSNCFVLAQKCLGRKKFLDGIISCCSEMTFVLLPFFLHCKSIKAKTNVLSVFALLRILSCWFCKKAAAARGTRIFCATPINNAERIESLLLSIVFCFASTCYANKHHYQTISQGRVGDQRRKGKLKILLQRSTLCHYL